MKETQKDTVKLFFSCDDNYIPFLAITLESLEENADKTRKYEIKVLNTHNISAENQKRIKDEYSVGCFNIEFVDITRYVEDVAEKLHTRDYYSKATYYRLFIPNMYPQYDKALYLDSDIIVTGNIAELYDIDLGNNLVGATTDEFVHNVPELWSYVENHVTVAKHDDYFNAGVLLMNLKELRKFNFEDKFIDTISKITFTVAQDQDYLNAICRGRVKYISGLWDKMPFEDKSLDINTVKLFHYNLDLKPWQKDNILYEEYFWIYAKDSGYYDKIMEIKKSFTKERIEVAKAQTVNLITLANNQANDIIENIRIKKILDALHEDEDRANGLIPDYSCLDDQFNLFGNINDSAKQKI